MWNKEFHKTVTWTSSQSKVVQHSQTSIQSRKNEHLPQNGRRCTFLLWALYSLPEHVDNTREDWQSLMGYVLIDFGFYSTRWFRIWAKICIFSLSPPCEHDEHVNDVEGDDSGEDEPCQNMGWYQGHHPARNHDSILLAATITLSPANRMRRPQTGKRDPNVLLNILVGSNSTRITPTSGTTKNKKRVTVWWLTTQKSTSGYELSTFFHAGIILCATTTRNRWGWCLGKAYIIHSLEWDFPDLLAMTCFEQCYKMRREGGLILSSL